MRLFLLFSIAVFVSPNSSAQINITNVNNGLQLAQKLLGNGVSISNVSFTAANGSCGFFNNVNSPIQLDSGIVLTSGYVKSGVPLTNTFGVNGLASGVAGNDNQAPGDASLNGLVSGLTFNASVLEFDFVPLGDTISFNYVFSSDEYPFYNCTDFNDVFAFFISKPGFPGNANMALIPGTNIPVAINSINDGTVISQNGGMLSTCNAMGTGSPFTGLYVNNMTGTILTHNGLTRKLRAFAVVVPCETYHLKIAIADVEDQTLDSGVFIEANSLKSNAANCDIVGNYDPVSNSDYLAEGCVSGTIVFTKSNPEPIPTNLSLFISGNATNGVDYTAIPTTISFPPNQTSVSLPITAFSDAFNEGTEYLNIYISSSCASGIFLDSAKIEIRDYQKLFIVPDTAFTCNGASKTLVASSGYSSYNWNPNPTLNNLTIPNPVATPVFSPTTYYCTATLGTCRARDSATLLFNDLILKSKKDIYCKNGTDGTITVSPGKGWIAPLQFTINGGAPQTDSVFNNLPVGNYTIQLTDATGCTKSMLVSLIQAFPDLTFSETITAPSCAVSGTIVVNGSGGQPPYSYALDGVNYQGNNILSFTTTGNITIYIKDANGCITTKNVNIVSPAAILVNTSVTPASCSGLPDGMILVNATNGTPPYQYSSDGGINFQGSSILMVTTGTKIIQVKDNAGCVVTQNIFVPFINSLIADAGLPVTICEGSGTQLNGSANGSNINWLPNTNIINANTLNPTVSPINTTWYYLTSSQGPCTKTDSVLIMVRNAPIPNAGNDTAICYADQIILNGSGGVQFNWSPNYNINFANTGQPVVFPLQTTKYWLQVTDGFGCKSLTADTVEIIVTPKIIVNAGKDTLIATNQTIQLQAISNAPNFIWSPATFLNNTTIANPNLTIPGTGAYLYIVKAITPEGCFAIDSILIKIYKGPEIYVPTAFTPNKDGKNDLLKITAVGLKEFNYFRIYNRWGKMIFETLDPEISWNGFYNNKEQPGATYVWMVEGVDYKNIKIQKKGTVVLIR